jgi:3-oxoacyl-ACP reductase-like protein
VFVGAATNTSAVDSAETGDLPSAPFVCRRRRGAGDQLMGRFDGKVALITGAASGIGRAITVRLSAEGASVFAAEAC